MLQASKSLKWDMELKTQIKKKKKHSIIWLV